MVVLSMMAVLASSTVHPRYNLSILPDDGGYSISLSYNARLKFIVPLVCKHESEVSHPSETTQPGLSIITTHVQSGSTAVTMFIPPSQHAPQPGTMFQASLLCERKVTSNGDGILFVLPFDVVITSDPSHSTRTVSFYVDRAQASGFADSESSIIQAAEEKCNQRLSVIQPNSLGFVSDDLLDGFSQVDHRTSDITKSRDVSVHIDQTLRIGRSMYVAFRIKNFGQELVSLKKADIESSFGNRWSVNVEELRTREIKIPGIEQDNESPIKTAIKTKGSASPGQTQYGVLGFENNQEHVGGQYKITWTLSDGRTLSGDIIDHEGGLW